MVKTLVKKYQVDFCSFIDENMMTMHVASKRRWLARELGRVGTAAGDGRTEPMQGTHAAGSGYADPPLKSHCMVASTGLPVASAR